MGIEIEPSGLSDGHYVASVDGKFLLDGGRYIQAFPSRWAALQAARAQVDSMCPPPVADAVVDLGDDNIAPEEGYPNCG